ncbi:hypothetical protein [Cupriavidus pampae]|uniref:hypothetical protein n=1 Tax=Cupriavidus pampae TaxID=659251 RepID=UPI001CC4447F|nr:hypothetical protein [Cupriavidus pampae]
MFSIEMNPLRLSADIVHEQRTTAVIVLTTGAASNDGRFSEDNSYTPYTPPSSISDI